MFNSLFGDGRLGGILAVIIGLCLLGLIIIYAWRAFGGAIRPNANRGGRQTRIGIVDAFDLDRHRQLVLVRRDNVEHLIMIGGPNDVLIEAAIVRAQPAGAERREPMSAPAQAVPRMAVEPVAAAPQVPAPVFDVKPVLEPAPAAPAAPMAPVPPLAPAAPPPPPPLRPLLDQEPVAPPPPLSRPAPGPGVSRPMPPRPPMRPMPPRPGAPTLAQRPVTPPPVAPPAPPVAPTVAPPAEAEPAAEAPSVQPAPAAPAEQPKEPPKLTVNIDSLEEEMAKLLGRSVEPPRS